MTTLRRLATSVFTAFALTALLVGCASDRALRDSERLVVQGRASEGIAVLEQAAREKPGDLAVRAALVRLRDHHLAERLARADQTLRAGDLDAAHDVYREVLTRHADNARALSGLVAVEVARGQRVLLEQARAALARDDLAVARDRLRGVLAQDPDQADARALLATLEERAGRAGALEAPALAGALRRPITLEFRDAPLKGVFDALSRQAGINLVFDKDVRLDQRATVFARTTPIADALDMVLATNQLARKTLNATTLLIYPNLPAKQRDYQEMAVRGFFLVNTDAKQVMAMLKAIARVRDVYVDEKLNMVMVRDAPEALALAERLVRLTDRPEPEVMLEVEILEVKRNKLMELGVRWPTQFSILSREEQEQAVALGSTASTVKSKVNAPLTIRLFKTLDDSDILLSPTPSLNLRKDDSDVNLLANPRIRVRNREKARIHIGDKVPVITSNVTSTGVTSESVSYLDVGLKLDVEPQVHLDGDVAMKVGLEVSNIVREVKSATGTLTYQLGSRNASTALRLRDGETQVLAGLISDEDRSGASKVPGLGDLPLIGRLFSTHRDEKSKTEIVLLITPRVLRNIDRPPLGDAEFFAGTEASVATQPLRLRATPEVSRRVPAPPGRLPPAAPPQPVEPAPVEAEPGAVPEASDPA